jgi:hypothetical protein
MIRIIAVGVKLVLRPLSAALARMDVVYVTDSSEFNVLMKMNLTQGWAINFGATLCIHSNVFSDGARVSLFSDGARVSLFSDGARVSLFSDGARVSLFSDSARVSLFSDGTRVSLFSDSARVSLFSDSARVSLFSDGARVSLRSNVLRRVCAIVPHQRLRTVQCLVQCLVQ